DVCRSLWAERVPGRNRLLGAGGAVQYYLARRDQSRRRLYEHRRHLHRLYNAWFPRSIRAVLPACARYAGLVKRFTAQWLDHPQSAPADQTTDESYTALGQYRRGSEWMGARSETRPVLAHRTPPLLTPP